MKRRVLNAHIHSSRVDGDLLFLLFLRLHLDLNLPFADGIDVERGVSWKESLFCDADIHVTQRGG